MKKIWILYKREVKSQFTGTMIYILSAVFIGLLSYLFINIFTLANQMQNLTVESAVMRPMFGNINTLFIFIIPLFAMKLLSEEKKYGTMNLLLLSPLSEEQIMASKVLVGMTFVLFFLGLTLIFPGILFLSGYENRAAILTGYGGAILNGMCCMMLSCFVSSLTKNAVLAALMGIFGILFFASLSWTAQTSQNFLISQIFEYLSLSSHYEPFSRGTIKTYDVVYYGSFFTFFWLLSIKSLQSRNW